MYFFLNTVSCRGDNFCTFIADTCEPKIVFFICLHVFTADIFFFFFLILLPVLHEEDLDIFERKCAGIPRRALINERPPRTVSVSTARQNPEKRLIAMRIRAGCDGPSILTNKF